MSFKYTNMRLRQHQAQLKLGAKLQYDRSSIERVNLQQLRGATPPEIVDRSFDVRLMARNYETGRMNGFRRTNYKYPTIYNQVRVFSRDVKSGSGTKHKSIIRFYGPPDDLSPVWVWCDCGYFTYTLEVPLKDHGSSDIKNSNGEPASIRNPSSTPYLCKHLFRASEWALTRTEDKASKAMEKLTVSEERAKGASGRSGSSFGSRLGGSGFKRFR